MVGVALLARDLVHFVLGRRWDDRDAGPVTFYIEVEDPYRPLGQTR